MTEKNKPSGTLETVTSSPDRLANIFVLSFRLAQFDLDQQKRILRYTKGLLPNVRMDDINDLLAIRSRSRELIYSILFSTGTPQERGEY